MFLETYAQTTVCLSYIRSAACVAFYLINSPFLVGWNVVVLGGLMILAMVLGHMKSIVTFVFFEYVCDLAYLWGNVCEYRPSLVFVRACVYCGVFCLMFYLVS